MDLSDENVQQLAEADRRVVDPPIHVESATWSKLASSIGGRKNGRNGGVGYAVLTASPTSAIRRQRWIQAVDLRPAP
jgi:hypothetical protein